MNKLKQRRAALKSQLTRVKNYIAGLEDIDCEIIRNLETKLTLVQPLLNQFIDIQCEIGSESESTDADLSETEITQYEESYCSVINKIKKIIGEFNSQNNHNQSNSSIGSESINFNQNNHNYESSVKLPVIKLPTFEGTYEGWFEFRDVFKDLIHQNKALSDIQKFHYLVSAVQGDAKKIIHSLSVTSANYKIAWDSLSERYENTGLIVHNYLKTIFDLSNIQKECHVRLRQLLDTVNNSIRALKALGRPVDQWDDILVYIVLSKLDLQTRKEWESHDYKGDLPTFKNMSEFLNKRCQILEKVYKKQDTIQIREKPINKFEPKFNKKASTAYVAAEYNIVCYFCKDKHALYSCQKFLDLLPEQRMKEIKILGLCLNCFRNNHVAKDCQRTSCKKCNKKHNTLLHFGENQNKTNNSDTTNNSNATTSETVSTDISVVNHSTNKQINQVLLATAVFDIHDSDGKAIKCRALLDSASQSSFITKDLCKKLKLPVAKANTEVKGIAQSSTDISFKTKINIKSNYTNFNVSIDCLILNNITEFLPTASFCKTNLDIPKNIKLADDSFNQRSKVDVLLGANVFWDVMCDKRIILGKNKPILQETKLGWVIAGHVITQNIKQEKSVSYLSLNALDRKISQFWELENCSYNTKRILSQTEIFCENHFKNNVTRDMTGRFVVSIPFKDNLQKLGKSRESTLKRFYALENKLLKNLDLKLQYDNFIKEYIDMKHMSEIIEPNIEMGYYLPHHAVLKDSSSTTKLRVVFDASHKTDSGLSLNNVQHVGPTIQRELFSILLNFRIHRYVMTADIAKMYRQMLIKPEERKFQQVFWRFSSNDTVKCYELNTVTYGTASASYLATRCLEQLASENECDLPNIAHIIRNDFYMDDLITGSNDKNDLIQMQQNLVKIFLASGFELRKWLTNVPEITKEFKFAENLGSNIIQLGDGEANKTLGILWNSNLDSLEFSINDFSTAGKITKRVILSNITQLFDPLGTLSPIIIVGKLTMQKMWLSKLSWDNPVPEDIRIQWLEFCNELKQLRQIKIPRNILLNNHKQADLIGFADASEKAYGACIFIRTFNTAGEIAVNLLCAKSRVAPTKQVSLPRLELCAAQLLANLSKKVRSSLNMQFKNEFYFSDSTITLCWLKAPASRWKTFVANRVGEIQVLTDINNWYHVRSSDNPADLISRGCSVISILESDLWWHGPKWLCQDILEWNLNSIESNEEVDLEIKPNISLSVVEKSNNFDLFTKYSSLVRLQRVTAYILRFTSNLKKRRNDRILDNLSCDELTNSMNFLVRLAQKQEFKQELKDLSSKKANKLSSLTPFLDKNNIIRVGGRLGNSNYNYDKTHPMLLPKKHPLTLLILKHEHERLLHCGPQMLLCSVREKFWPILGRNTAKQIVRKCIKCFKCRPTQTSQIMGSLPAERVSCAPPFYNTGVDYAGPFLLKDRPNRGYKLIKSYVCLFICFATKAIHVEVVADLTTEAFISALRRFISRRGKPQNIYSDNGTNFVGANSELKNLYTLLGSDDCTNKITNELSQNQISWKFIPPRSPNFGGLWEANIKSLKNHLKRIIGNAYLTYEEFSTVLIQIEAILNSRPLIPLSEDPNELEVLTPSHFLIGRKLTSAPDPDVKEVPVNRLSRYQLVQAMQQHFWSRWSKEYLCELQRKNKWTVRNEQLNLGAMVLLRDDNLPPLRWSLGRVIAVHPGPDGNSRVATVRTKNGDVKRAISKLCFLPIAE